jgi:hypothetical protein
MTLVFVFRWNSGTGQHIVVEKYAENIRWKVTGIFYTKKARELLKSYHSAG